MSDFVDAGEKAAAKSIVGDIYLNIKNLYKSLDISKAKFDAYRHGLRENLINIQIMGMADPRKISELYVTLTFKGVEKIQSSRGDVGVSKRMDDVDYLKHCLTNGLTKGDIEKGLDELGFGHEFFSDVGYFDDGSELEVGDQVVIDYNKQMQGVNAISAIDKHQKCVVLAGPGSGKTTFLKYCALAYAGHLPVSKKLTPKLPIFVPLREIERVGTPNGSPNWLLKVAASFASDVSNQDFTEEWLKTQLVKGNCILLLDGLDEVPEKLVGKCIQSVKSFSHRYGDNHIVLSCRKPAYKRGLIGFTNFEIEEFSQKDIQHFAMNWFSNDGATAAKFLNDLEQAPSALSICKTPLLATLFCIMYGYARSLPSHRAELYERCIDALMFHWDTYRAIDRTSISSSLSPSRKKYILARVARVSYDENAYLFRHGTLLKLLVDALARLGLENEVSPRNLLSEIQENHGLIVERSPGVFAFSHLSFHEYFCAYDFTQSGELPQLFQLYKKDTRYREILLLSIELAYDPNPLVLGIIALAKEASSRSKDAHYLAEAILELRVPMDERLRVVLQHLVSNRSSSRVNGENGDLNDDDVVAVDEALSVGAFSASGYNFD
jgi:predicted NACHT family NTPase